jgi:hypothetical protein
VRKAFEGNEYRCLWLTVGDGVTNVNKIIVYFGKPKEDIEANHN